MASFEFRGGNIVGKHRAKRLFPEPGGPMRSRLCPPAAAISRALRAFGMPFTSRRLVDVVECGLHVWIAGGSFIPFISSVACSSESAASIFKPQTAFASAAFFLGRISDLMPISFASSASESAPFMGLN